MASDGPESSRPETRRRAAQRGSRHRQVPGFCNDCVMDELQEMLLEENPDLSRGDAHDLAWEWVA